MPGPDALVRIGTNQAANKRSRIASAFCSVRVAS